LVHASKLEQRAIKNIILNFSRPCTTVYDDDKESQKMFFSAHFKRLTFSLSSSKQE
jgi:hypothetical protein